jgi:hypothetical protein
VKTILKNICLLVYAGIVLVGGCVGGVRLGYGLTYLSAETLRDGDSIPPRFPVVAVLVNEKGEQEVMVLQWWVLSNPEFLKKYQVATYLVPQSQGSYRASNDTHATFKTTEQATDRQTVEVDYSSDIMFILALQSRYEATREKISPRYYREVGFWPVVGTAAVCMIVMYGILYFLKLKLVMLVSRRMAGWAPKNNSVLSSLAEATTELIVLRTAKPQQQQPPTS